MNQDEIINQILHIKPFSQFLKIKEIKSLKGHGAISGESFLVVDESNNQFKLRVCSTEEQAKRIENNVKLLPHAFPKFYGREGLYVLFEWVEGELLYNILSKPISAEICYQIGKLVGEAHQLNDINHSKSADKFFYSLTKTLDENAGFDKVLLEKIIQKYKKLRDKITVDVVLEINDIHPRNFVIQNSSNPENIKIYFVDEDGFGHKIKGLGMAKPLFIEGLIKTKEQTEAFWKGYTEHHSKDYFDKDYQEFVTIVQLVRSMVIRSKNGKDISDLIDLIKEYI